MKRILIAAIVFASVSTQASAQTTESARIKAGLTHEQMHQLQQALKDDGCYSGRVDGVIGPATRRAIACSRKKHDLTGNNVNALFRAINLDVTLEDSTGMGGVMKSGRSSGYRPPERRRDRGTVSDTAAPTRSEGNHVKGMVSDTFGLHKKAAAKPVKP